MIKFARLIVATAAVALALTGCFIVADDPTPTFDVEYTVTKAFAVDDVQVQYTNSSGNLVNGSFTDTEFNRTVTVDEGTLVRLIVEVVGTGQADYSMRVVRNSDDEVVFTQTATCNSNSTCTLSDTP